MNTYALSLYNAYQYAGQNEIMLGGNLWHSHVSVHCPEELLLHPIVISQLDKNLKGKRPVQHWGANMKLLGVTMMVEGETIEEVATESRQVVEAAIVDIGLSGVTVEQVNLMPPGVNEGPNAGILEFRQRETG